MGSGLAPTPPARSSLPSTPARGQPGPSPVAAARQRTGPRAEPTELERKLRPTRPSAHTRSGCAHFCGRGPRSILGFPGDTAAASGPGNPGNAGRGQDTWVTAGALQTSLIQAPPNDTNARETAWRALQDGVSGPGDSPAVRTRRPARADGGEQEEKGCPDAPLLLRNHRPEGGSRPQF